jgi:hypothetical protein
MRGMDQSSLTESAWGRFAESSAAKQIVEKSLLLLADKDLLASPVEASRPVPSGGANFTAWKCAEFAG